MEEFKDTPFSRLNRMTPEQLRAFNDARYEHSRVCFTIGRVGLSKYLKPMIKRCSTYGLDGRLTFRAFNATFPSFPFWLGCSRLDGLELHLDKNSIQPAWFKRFRTLPFFLEFRQLFDDLGDDVETKPVAFVFPRKGFQQGLVIHNGDLRYIGEHGSAHVYYGGGKSPLNLVVQPYSSFLDNLYAKGHGWKNTDNPFE